MQLDPQLLEILACPSATHRCASTRPRRSWSARRTQCGLAYPVRDEIPVLLIDEARRPGEPQ